MNQAGLNTSCVLRQGPPVFNPDALVRAIRDILDSQRENLLTGPLDDVTYFADSLRVS